MVLAARGILVDYGPMLPRIYLVRHGETAWSLTGQHTGLTDIPLTENGVQQAVRLGGLLRESTFSRVFTSPLQRARRTCELSGFGSGAEIDPDLVEWNYGEFEGLTSVEIRTRQPDWSVFAHGAPAGESVEQLTVRADRVVARLQAESGNVLVFAHGHFLRALAARWIGLPVAGGQRLLLNPASLSILAFDHHRLEEPAIALWNADVQALIRR